MPGHVIQGFLDDPVGGRLDLRFESSAFDAQMAESDLDPGLLGVPVKMPQQRRQKPQVVQQTGPQIEGQIAHARGQIADQRLRPLEVGPEIFRGVVSADAQAQFERGQQLPQLIVQFAGDVAPLRLLHFQELAREALLQFSKLL